MHALGRTIEALLDRYVPKMTGLWWILSVDELQENYKELKNVNYYHAAYFLHKYLYGSKLLRGGLLIYIEQHS